jgi:putative ABC transport system ATP-binding protein
MTGFDVELDRVSKRYRLGDQEMCALDDVSLHAKAGEMIAVMGPSGSGKSTLLHVVGAMDTASEGAIRVDGFQVDRLSASQQTQYRRRIGFVFQRFHLLPALSALNNVAAPLLPTRVPFDKHERARSLLHTVGLDGKEHQLPSRLSGGEQQRVAIARALINQPGLLLADEPTGNLDTKTGEDIVELLLELRRLHGMTVLVATHDSTVASRCDRTIELRDGRVANGGAIQPKAASLAQDRNDAPESRPLGGKIEPERQEH